jgi:predicted RND superfamily exporter protein
MIFSEIERIAMIIPLQLIFIIAVLLVFSVYWLIKVIFPTHTNFVPDNAEFERYLKRIENLEGTKREGTLVHAEYKKPD